VNRLIFGVLLLLLGVAVVFGRVTLSLAQAPVEPGVKWEAAMRIPSPDEISAWFPTLAVDSQGRVHAVWNETDHFGVKHSRDIESVYYSMWDGRRWLPANDIIPSQPDIIRNAIAIDNRDVLHIVYGWIRLYYKQANAGSASSAGAWTTPKLVNTRQGTYWSDIAVDRDTIHILYDDVGSGDANNLGSDMYYRLSTDRGQTWTDPIALFPNNVGGSSRPHIKIDRGRVIHLTWDEGWDRFSDKGKPEFSVYMNSRDGGHTWSEPTLVSYPHSDNLQLVSGSDGRGGVMLVWRTMSTDNIYYMWSTDYGQSWSPPGSLPNVMARTWGGPFDTYDMATDSNGHIHLLAVVDLSAERRRNKFPPGLYHFEWNGSSWSAPNTVYEGDWYPQYPKLVISRGNQFDAVWFVADDVWNGKKPNQVWYAHGQSNAPAETPQPLPTFTPTPLPPTPQPTVTPTVQPTIAPEAALAEVPAGLVDSIFTEYDEVILLLKSLVPAVLIVVVVVLAVRYFRR